MKQERFTKRTFCNIQNKSNVMKLEHKTKSTEEHSIQQKTFCEAECDFV